MTNIVEGLNIENVANQIIIETSASAFSPNLEPQNRIDFINGQKSNKYSSKSCPFLVHVESINNTIGNLHPTSLKKILYNKFPSIINIKRISKI